MSPDNVSVRITDKTVVYRVPGMEEVPVRRDLEYRRDGDVSLGMDIYFPPESKAKGPFPAVVFVTGYPDAGYLRMFGRKQMEMGSYTSWARLAAASGFAAVTYANTSPSADAEAVLRYVRQNAASLNIDGKRLAVWACSGNVPNALSLCMKEDRAGLKCAALLYGYLLDLDGSTAVADAAAKWGFADPVAGKAVDDLPRDLPLMLVRAGHDETPGLNETLDRFVSKALVLDLPVTLVNHAGASHTFDISSDDEPSRAVIRQVLAFLAAHLGT